MRTRAAGLAIGVAFGVTLSWSGMTAPDVIRGALLFRHGYLFLFMFAAMITATAGSWLLRRAGVRALLTGRPVTWPRERPQRRHVLGALVFGVGWGVADACPGPIATQLGQGAWWGLWTLAGMLIGVWLFLHRRRVETEPAVEPVNVAAAGTYP
jgi:uncharacterized membrane protein YedE/YeeE